MVQDFKFDFFVFLYFFCTMGNYIPGPSTKLGTPLRIDLLCMENWGTHCTIEISSNECSAPMAIKKIKLVGAALELLAKQHCQFSPFGPFSQ